jgi:hypothetical protein
MGTTKMRDSGGGWLVAIWGLIVANIPSASQCLVLVSIFVGLLQSAVLLKKLKK